MGRPEAVRAGEREIGSDGVADQGEKQAQRTRQRSEGEDGFLLLGAIIAIFLVLLVLSLAAPTMARQLRRDREVEALHRGDQYQRAIRLYYLKFKHYPGSMEQLEKSNNIRFLRQKYVDPMTGKADWRLIHMGEQKTTVKGFFGKPLAGIATSGMGSVGDQASGLGGVAGGSGPLGVGGAGGVGAGGLGAGSLGAGSSAAGSGIGGTGTSSGPTLGGLGGTSPGGSGGLSPTGVGGASAPGIGGSGPNGIPSQSAGSFSGSGAPIVGIGSSAAGDSIVVLNEQTTHPTWEFIYDPRIEQMKSKSNLLGGGMAAGSGSGGLGSLGAGAPIGAPAGPVSGPNTSPTTTPSAPPSSPATPQP